MRLEVKFTRPHSPYTRVQLASLSHTISSHLFSTDQSRVRFLRFRSERTCPAEDLRFPHASDESVTGSVHLHPSVRPVGRLAHVNSSSGDSIWLCPAHCTRGSPIILGAQHCALPAASVRAHTSATRPPCNICLTAAPFMNTRQRAWLVQPIYI